MGLNLLVLQKLFMVSFSSSAPTRYAMALFSIQYVYIHNQQVHTKFMLRKVIPMNNTYK